MLLNQEVYYSTKVHHPKHAESYIEVVVGLTSPETLFEEEKENIRRYINEVFERNNIELLPKVTFMYISKFLEDI